MNFKLLILNFFVFFYCYSYSQEMVTYYYSDSTISSQGSMRNGKPDGYWKNYYANGTLQSYGKRTNFELDSIWSFYSEQGIIEKQITYDQGKKNGFAIEYSFINNELLVVSKTMYINDKRHGNSYLYKNGVVYKIIPYENDIMQGVGFELNKDSVVIAIENYTANQLLNRQAINRTDAQGKKTGVWMDFYPNSNVKTEAHYVQGKLQGTYKLFDTQKRLIRVGEYQGDSLLYSSQTLIDFKEPTEIIHYYSDSTIQFRGTFSQSVPIGIHRYYSTKGMVDSSVLYNTAGERIAQGIMLNNGRKEGLWIYFDSLQKVCMQGYYVNDKKHGAWNFYYSNGALKQEGFYVYDEISGVWKWYYESGKLKQTEEFAMNKRNGKSIQYNEQGKKIVEGTYIDDKQHGVWKTQIGDIITSGKYEYGSKVKYWESKYVTNKIQYKGNYFNGRPVGKHIFYYANGQIEHIELYSNNGKPRKAWPYYSMQGELLYVVYYKHGEEEKIVSVLEKK